MPASRTHTAPANACATPEAGPYGAWPWPRHVHDMIMRRRLRLRLRRETFALQAALAAPSPGTGLGVIPVVCWGYIVVLVERPGSALYNFFFNSIRQNPHKGSVHAAAASSHLTSPTSHPHPHTPLSPYTNLPLFKPLSSFLPPSLPIEPTRRDQTTHVLSGRQGLLRSGRHRRSRSALRYYILSTPHATPYPRPA